MHRLRRFLRLPLAFTPIQFLPVNKRLRNFEQFNLFQNLHLYTKNPFEPQAPDHLE